MAGTARAERAERASPEREREPDEMHDSRGATPAAGWALPCSRRTHARRATEACTGARDTSRGSVGCFPAKRRGDRFNRAPPFRPRTRVATLPFDGSAATRRRSLALCIYVLVGAASPPTSTRFEGARTAGRSCGAVRAWSASLPRPPAPHPSPAGRSGAAVPDRSSASVAAPRASAIACSGRDEVCAPAAATYQGGRLVLEAFVVTVRRRVCVDEEAVRGWTASDD